MKTTVVGLFSSCDEAVNAAKILKKTGLKNLKLACKELSDDRKNMLSAYLGSFLGIYANKPVNVLRKKSENLVAGIFSKNAEELEKARTILKNAGAVHVFSFENMSRVESKSKEFIMKMIALAAKSEIRLPLPLKHHESHEGISMIT